MNTSLSPQTLPKLSPENHLDISEARWFAVYTKYKREKLVHKLLNNKGITNYLPLQQVTRRYVRKIRHLELPLISCYIFVKITKEDYIRVLETENVLKFVRFSKNLISIPEKEMEIMKRVVGENNLEIIAEPWSLCLGDKVEIISGNLTGLQGKLVEKPGNHQMIIELENLGYMLRLNVPVELLQKIK